jgi:dienelactone hydrolase
MVSNICTVSAVCFALVLAQPVYGGEYEAASRGEAFANPSKDGTRELKSIVWYPAEAGTKKLAKAPKGGFSVLVYLHGRGGPAFAYNPIGKTFAKNGFIVVLSDTALTDPRAQRFDGIGLFKALAIANKSNPFWQGSLNMSSVGLAGHSMGGGSTAHILADNPGYKAGFCFAPWQGGRSFKANAKRITAPVGIIHGKGDRTLPWASTGKRLYDALPADCERFLYLMDGSVTHLNLAVNLPWGKKLDKEIYGQIEKMCLAFFQKHLQGQGAALDSLLKQDNGDSRLVKLYRGAGSASPQARPKTPAKAKSKKARLY